MLLMDKILHQLGCIKPCKWEIYHINWCKISSINSIKSKKENSSKVPKLHFGYLKSSTFRGIFPKEITPEQGHLGGNICSENKGKSLRSRVFWWCLHHGKLTTGTQSHGGVCGRWFFRIAISFFFPGVFFLPPIIMVRSGKLVLGRWVSFKLG